MEKEYFIELLKNYKENEAKLKKRLKKLMDTRNELKDFEDNDTSVTAILGINNDIHSKNQISNKVLKKVEDNETKREELKQKIKDLEKEVKELRKKVDEVKDRLECLKYKEDLLVRAYYIEGRTAEDIGNNLHKKTFGMPMSERQVQRIIDRSIKKLINL